MIIRNEYGTEIEIVFSAYMPEYNLVPKYKWFPWFFYKKEKFVIMVGRTVYTNITNYKAIKEAYEKRNIQL